MIDNLELESDSENQFSDDDNSGSKESSENNSSANESDEGNAGWANSMAKILKANSNSRTCIVLSKSKKLNDVKSKEEKKYDFQVEGELNPDIKEEKIKTEDFDDKTFVKSKISRQKARLNMRICRVKPVLTDRDRERSFKKIATKGVVQLFNAVKTQQKEISKKLEAAGRLDHRRERVLNSLDKRAFLDVLMAGDRAKSELVDNPVKDEFKNEDSNDEGDDENESPAKKKKSWDIFKPDFLVNKKLSNWDKNQESDEEVNEDDRGNMNFESDDENST